ncbi:negative transcriptional regulator, PaiB family [Halopseudomonas xinjiangensis]|uniref:Negative transcriptional regulator, PaiB family n=1 Tax=Halopseudomonas xinjiangensis TaxID=487184 RepID=A0A1H1VKQ1_9GAMM|nr:FMN-binding negative transcriptional regulator [Halopseudomonas xinjiangensis]SDS84941.1 negative transcriptional regulator, PaiB family [Halopseudomonas xinjiangensis]
MYVPSHFKQDNTETLLQYIRQHGFGLLIVADEQGIEANHVPFYLSESDGCMGVLQCHLARGNPVWQRLEQGAKVLVVFKGPHAYVSPSWYPSKAEHGRVVPTWNYLAVHVEGPVRLVEDAGWLGHHLRALSGQHESGRASPWSVDDAPRDYTNKLIRGIVGVEIRIDKLTGKLKASQNQPEANRAGVKAGLADDGEHAMADLIE